MKKAMPFLLCLLFVLMLILPAGSIICNTNSYSFKLTNALAYTITVAVFAVCVVILDLALKIQIENSVLCILLALIMPLSLWNAAFYIFEENRHWEVISILITTGCCCVLSARHGRPFKLLATSSVLSALMMVPLCFVSCFWLLFGGGIGQNTVVKTVNSPSGNYYAQVIDSNQGALGGDTMVDVYQHSKLHTAFFIIEKKPLRVYSGDWGEFQDMVIYWKNDECLIINDVEYPIN